MTDQYRAVFEAATTSNLRPIDRMVLICIALDQKEYPDNLPMPNKLLAAYAGVDKRSVMRATKVMREMGILSSESGKSGIHTWTINIDAIPKSTLSVSDLAKKTKPVAKQLRQAIIERYGEQCSVPGCNTCGYIGVDHIIPKSRGGTDDLGNLHLLCSNHNSQKGVSSWDEFIQRLQKVES